MKPFWMVLGSGMPNYRHASESAARNEAGRLARLEAGKEFIVLKFVASCVVNEMQWCEAETEDLGFNDSYVESVVSQKPQWRDPVLLADIGLRAKFSDCGKYWIDSVLTGINPRSNDWISGSGGEWKFCQVTDDKKEMDVPF